MPISLSRRKFLKKGIGTILSLIGIGSGGYIYSRYIEPKRLEVKHITVKHNKIPLSFDQMNIVQFSDTHLGFQYTLDQLEDHVNRINSLNPDIVFFTGDLMDEPNHFPYIKKIPPILNQIQAPFGKFAVYGNHDHGGYGTNIYMNTMKNSGFSVLRNEGTTIQQKDGSKIHIAGIDDAMLGTPNLTQALKSTPKDAFQILLSHAPDLADAASTYNVDFQLSGHSHGGQVQIPFFGALITPPYGKKYPEGEYHLNHNYPLYLYVNRGLGTTRLPLRFLSVPEITVFTLKATDY